MTETSIDFQSALAQEASARLARHLGETRMQLVEAQTAADLHAAENAMLRARVEALAAQVQVLAPKTADAPAAEPTAPAS